MTEVWYESRVRLKDTKAVVKFYDEQDVFQKSIVIPTIKWPLNGKYEVFHAGNTIRITDERILSVFDQQTYRIGKCYTNVKVLLKDLRNAGISAKSYVGWLFTAKDEEPIHHCWVVVHGRNGNSLLDLSDDFTVMLSEKNREGFSSAKTKEDARELMANFTAAAKKMKNRIRCAPVGIPTNFLLYIGCECEPYDGINIYKELMTRFPDHECQRNCDRNGLNMMQKKLMQMGLMD